MGIGFYGDTRQDFPREDLEEKFKKIMRNELFFLVSQKIIVEHF
jgi:hypothetical protein